MEKGSENPMAYRGKSASVRGRVRRKSASGARRVPRAAGRGTAKKRATRKPSAARSAGTAAQRAASQVVKLVLEQLPPSVVSRPEMAMAKEGVIAHRKGKAIL